MSNLRARATLVDQFLEVTGRSRHQVELELEPAHVVVAGLCEVLLDMLGEVG